MPADLERCVEKVQQQGHDQASAYAICNAAIAKGMTEEQIEALVIGAKKISYDQLINQITTPEPVMNLSYVKSLGLIEIPDVAVKSIGKDEIQGYTNIWGNPDKVDLDREFFQPDTDFWDGVLPPVKTAPRPLTWDHAQDESTKADPVIGEIVDMGDDKIGRWYVAKLKRAHQYRSAVDKLISERAVGTSSDSAPQYIVREKSKSGATWLKRWPLFAAALTETPCEPRMVGTIDYFKSLGLSLPNPEASEEQARAWLDNAKRKTQILKFFITE